MKENSVTYDKTMLRRYVDLKRSGIPDNEILSQLGDDFKASKAAVRSITSFYQIDTGKDRICTGLPCALRYTISPEDENIKHFEKESCLGYCDHAPVVRLDLKYFTRIGKTLMEIPESKREYVLDAREDISRYKDKGGYGALAKLLKADNYEEFIEAIRKSGLKGMGGAGFPVTAKWKSLADDSNHGGYLLINGHEGEPGTFKDRHIMEIYPHRVIEGALLAAILNGLHNVLIAIKMEYENANESIRNALEELRRNEPDLFEQINIQIISVPGGYVTGEETALMETIEGNRGEPRLRPPFPTQRGLYGRPTLVHNVETVYHLPEILSSNGNALSKFYSLTGDVRSPGLFKEKLGIEATELIEKYGSSSSHGIKAFMPGGLSGGILPGKEISISLDFDSVRKAGAGLGTGAFIALSKDRCIVDISYKVSKFFEKESCGKCVPCRLGTRRITSLLKDVASGNATEVEIEDGKRIAEVMIDGSICALGQVAGRTFLDTLARFGDEFHDHLEGKCPAGVCFTEGKQ